MPSSWVKNSSRYTEVINLRFPHRGTASLAQVSTMGLCPLLVSERVEKLTNCTLIAIPGALSSETRGP